MRETAKIPPGDGTVRLFTNHREALFVKRPNRFLIIARDGDEEIACHCPNPGRLIEFVFPGSKLILERRAPFSPGPGRAKSPKAKTGWTAVGIHYRDGIVPLFSSRANKAAETLILKKIIPGLREIHGEFTLGASRFDFLCIDGKGNRHLVEVKACSLIEYGVAMFPDAPSGRALKHLEELAALWAEGYTCHVLFVIVHGKARVFIPNIHTDPAFAAALSRYGNTGDKSGVRIHAALLCCDREGRAALTSASVPVDLSHGELAESNRGNYLILLKIPISTEIITGALGPRLYAPGWYVYAGSARKNLSARVNRHLRKNRKQKHWHLDYLTPQAETIKALPIRSYRNLECSLAKALDDLGGTAIPGFGCSDCRCKSHLFYFTDPPMGNRAFVDLLLKFRHETGLQREG
ncbi:MAG: DNA/RNA nuclease SfsA [Spirochaetaceae bacterium]|jgi:sugar fermentation stimulation protein A|nr:DNA/RNA nuclease SfsA [Spirochaetaceae bacterium]